MLTHELVDPLLGQVKGLPGFLFFLIQLLPQRFLLGVLLQQLLPQSGQLRLQT